MAPILINKDVVEPSYNCLKFTVQTHNYFTTNLIKWHQIFAVFLLCCKVGSQEIFGVTGKLGLGVQSEAEKRLAKFCKENKLAIANALFQQHKR